MSAFAPFGRMAALAARLFTIDLRSLAAFRIALGGLLALSLVRRATQLTAHYTDAGVLPRDALRELSGIPALSLHMLSGEAWLQALFFGIQILAALMLLVGWRTRLATAVSFLLLLSLHGRNPLVNHGADLLTRFLLFWSIVLPLGARWSLDARRRTPGPRPAAVLSVASAALLMQSVLLYLGASISKAETASWYEGRALYAVMNKVHYLRPLGEWLGQFPALLEALTYGSLVYEIALPLLLLCPFRTDTVRFWTVVSLALFHLGLFISLDIGFFQPVSVIAVIPFLPAAFWDRLGVDREPAPATSGVVVGPGETGPSGAGAPDEAAVLPSPPRVLSWSSMPRSERWANVLLGVILVWVSWIVVMGLFPRIVVPPRLALAAQTLQLDQKWRMFGNTDLTAQGWFVVVGYLSDGRRVNLFDGPPGAELSFERPDDFASRFPTHTWRKLYSNMTKPQMAVFRPYLADYKCREFNDAAGGGVTMDAVEVVFVARRAVDPEVPVTVERRSLVRRECPSASATSE